ncbi:nucleotide sugar dehydrogenase [Neosynechococcus sphagnicola]|uniref:nucleotide sugar dehydrogenase n=1 Tax=Neosynechococcus sphagnicola TaxID=1501145 RepID=UPI001EF9F304|nr:nucleotide sugar dehydrogenase [Neosynechococcus sphagnicola]
MADNLAPRLLEQIHQRTAKVGVIGLGYVGLPLAILAAKQGFPVLGFDIDIRKIEQLCRKESYIEHIPSAWLQQIDLQATDRMEKLAEVDIILLCVPTPLGDHREPNLSYVLNSTTAIAATLRPGQLILLESTTYPGTTNEEVLPILAAGGFQVGVDFFLGYSPEREDPGNSTFNTSVIPKVVSGITPTCLALTQAFYDQFVVKTVPVSSTQVAEATKILENTYRAVNIALVNELKVLFQRMGIDIWEVIQASSTKPFGFQPFYPGPGLGGHCIPIDPFYLTWKAHEYDLHTRFIELAGEINTAMPHYVLGQLTAALNQRCRSVNGAKILILGVAYKKNCGRSAGKPSPEVNRSAATTGRDRPVSRSPCSSVPGAFPVPPLEATIGAPG